jgi:hypothetical protein
VGEGPKSTEVSATPIAEPNPTPGFDVLACIFAIAVSMGVIGIRRRVVNST